MRFEPYGFFIGVDEVPAVYIIDIAVAVVIHALFAVELRPITDIARQILVSVVDAAVHDRHDHIVAPCRNLPCTEKVDVSPRHGIGERAVVHIVPLLGQQRVIDRVCRCRVRALRALRRNHHGTTPPHTFDFIDWFGILYRLDLRQLASGARYRAVVIVPHIVPTVEPSLAGACLKPACGREYTPHPRNAECRRPRIELFHASAHSARTRNLYMVGHRTFAEFDTHPACDCIAGGDGRRGGLRSQCLLRLVGDTRCQHCGREQNE